MKRSWNLDMRKLPLFMRDFVRTSQ